MALNFLRELFPHKTEQRLTNIIELVEQSCPTESFEYKMEVMFDMLSGQEDDDDQEEGAVGYENDDPSSDVRFDRLKDIFPDADESYLWSFCAERKNGLDLNDDVEILSREGYVTKVVDIDSVFDRLKEALPLASPEYLKKQAQELSKNNFADLEEFVNAAIENNDFPTMDEYLKQKKQHDTLNFYKSPSNVVEFAEKFCKIIPDPEKHFQTRINPLEQDNVSEDDLNYGKTFLYNKYLDIRKKHIDLVFKIKNKNLLMCCEFLDRMKRGMKQKRTIEQNECDNLELVQEVAYLTYRNYIRRVIKYKDDLYKQFQAEARALNLLETCGICMDDELIPEECFTCKKGCIFCKECLKKYVEVRMGDGLTNFPCCNDCDAEFSLHIIQLVLPQSMFERLVLKIQSEEIKRANVDGMETCPFCDFANIPPENSTIFACENETCMKESCRICKHESHIPKRCNEIEYDEDVQRRTFIENMMTDALARNCPRCNKKIIKSDGCNKMTCTCGAKLCFLCWTEISGYEHFGNNMPCQLHTNDVQISLERVRRQAERAKQQLGNVEIKFDPTKDIDKFF